MDLASEVFFIKVYSIGGQLNHSTVKIRLQATKLMGVGEGSVAG